MYKSKADQNRDLEIVRREFTKQDRIIKDAYLDGDRDSEERQDIYYTTFTPHNFNEKRQELVKKHFPECADAIKVMIALKESYHSIKNTEIQKKEVKEVKEIRIACEITMRLFNDVCSALKENDDAELQSKIDYVNTLKADPQNRQARREAPKFIQRLLDVGPIWIEELTSQHEFAVYERNVAIARRLEQLGILEVSQTEREQTRFSIKVKTNEGEKSIWFQTILAGGYNIQCLHNRVLVKVI